MAVLEPLKEAGNTNIPHDNHPSAKANREYARKLTAFLKELATELKRACGAGGAVVENTVEIEGDMRDRIRTALAKKGWAIKG